MKHTTSRPGAVSELLRAMRKRERKIDKLERQLDKLQNQAVKKGCTLRRTVIS